MSEHARLGPFEVGERIGEGGMGAVYRGYHVETGELVAIKVLLAAVARQSAELRNFRREVQALAKLHHPGIAAILDYGEIDEASASRGPDAFTESAPWFAMEFVDGAPIPKQAGDWEWEELESFLFQTLDALAYAHARSIVHRDLKPDNILLERTDDGSPNVKVVDFGIARLFDEVPDRTESRSSKITGTPKYMAPEQIRGDWREQGPWTDLYALACLTWRLVCGAAPFEGPHTAEILQKHIRADPPKFGAKFPVPDAMEQWLRRMLRKSPHARTQMAADAAWRLLQLGEPRRVSEPEEATNRGAQPDDSPDGHNTIPPMMDTIRDPEFDHPGEPGFDPAEGYDDPAGYDKPTDAASAQLEDEVPPVFPDWRREGDGQTAAVLPKAGLQLFGLREIPIVDRERTRDTLWKGLRTVKQSGEPQLVTLEGGTGTGKSRLAQWICRRAHETGAARSLEAKHTAHSGPDDGLRGLVRRAFRASGLERGELFEHVLEQLAALPGGERDLHVADARALTELAIPTDDTGTVEGPRYRFSSAAQKYALLRRLFDRLAHRRPLIVWLDDLQWGRGAIELVEHLFDAAESGPPVLLVATVRTDLLEDDPDLEQRLAELREAGPSRRVDLAPIDRDDHRSLIDRLLHLTPDLADRLAERTQGNPLFAIQLLRDWVDRGLLVAGDRGFELREGTAVDMPESMHQLWLQRLERLVDEHSPADGEAAWKALELAAALGREVDAAEWQAVLADLQRPPPDDLVDRLVERGLAERTSSGWAFAHGLLVDSLERRAREAGRRREHHRRCARLLREVLPADEPGVHERIADHLLEASERERAIEPLLEEIRCTARHGHDEQRRRILDRLGRLLDALELPDDDVRLLEFEIQEAAHWVDAGDLERTQSILSSVWERASAEQHGVRARAAYHLATCQRTLGDWDGTETWARRAVEAAGRAGATGLEGRAHRRLGWALSAAGDRAEAVRQLERARELGRRAGDRYGEIEAMRLIASNRKGDDGVDAPELLEQVREEAREAGYTELEGLAINDLGELARFDGRLDDARELYEAYLRKMREVSRPSNLSIGELNLAFIELRAGNFDRALELRDSVRRRSEQIGAAQSQQDLLHLIELTHAAGVADRERFRQCWEPLRDEWPDDWRVIEDYPWLLETAAYHAAVAGWEREAAEVRETARHFWRELGLDELAEQLGDAD